MNEKEHIKKYFIINNFKNKKIYHLHNIYHLGDNVFNFILFYIIKDYIENNNITIFYYAKKEYISQLKEFIPSKNIHLYSLEFKPDFSIELWVNNDYLNYRHDKQPKPINYNRYYIHFFNVALRKLSLNVQIFKLYYSDFDLITRYEYTDNKYKNTDILILNSTPLSGQFNYDKDLWNEYIIKLDQRFKILTTTKVDGILSTSDDNLSIKDIASLSTKVKVIIAINSGVVPGLLNYYTLTNVKHVYIFDNRCYYSYPNFENKKHINDITVEELAKYIN